MVAAPTTILSYFAMMEALFGAHPYLSGGAFLRMTLNPTAFGFVELNDFVQAQSALKTPYLVAETPQISGSENPAQRFRRFQCGFLLVGQQSAANDSATQALLHSEIEVVCSQLVGWIHTKSQTDWGDKISMSMSDYSAHPVSGLGDDNLSGFYVDFSYLVLSNPEFNATVITL